MRSDPVLTIAQELAEVGRLVDGDDIPAIVDRYVRRAVATLPGCDYAAIVVTDRSGAPEVVASAGAVRAPDPAEAAGRAGPVTEVLRYGEPRRLADIATDDRWPDFSAFLGRCGYRSCLVLPLPARQEPGAAFILYAERPDQFGAASNDLALLFTLNAGVAFDNAGMYHDSLELIEHLSTALRSRTVIGQAQGLLMRHYGWESEVSFAAMKRASQNHNVKLRALAGHLVDAHHARAWTSALREYGLVADDQGDAQPPVLA